MWHGQHKACVHFPNTVCEKLVIFQSGLHYITWKSTNKYHYKFQTGHLKANSSYASIEYKIFIITFLYFIIYNYILLCISINKSFYFKKSQMLSLEKIIQVYSPYSILIFCPNFIIPPISQNIWKSSKQTKARR